MKSWIACFVSLCSGVVLAAEPARPPIVVEDFAAANFAQWEVHGKAFGKKPVGVEGLPGVSHAVSSRGLPAETGNLFSPEFAIERRFINLALAGGDQEFYTCVNLWVGDRIERTVTGGGNSRLHWSTWDVSSLAGRKARIEIVDKRAPVDQFIEVATIVQADAPQASATGEVAPAVGRGRAQALAAVAANVARAAADPQRPIYHFHPPAQRMNDPNGPFYLEGQYHLFYQFNPYTDGTGDGAMMWGHALSRDLVNWKDLGIALWPSWERGEAHCYSGGAVFDSAGRPMLFYASVPNAVAPRQQWAAVSDDPQLLRWRKIDGNPLLKLGDPTVPADCDPMWRDPFLFTAGGRTFMLLAATHIPLYEAANPQLTRWTYRGVFYSRPKLSVECPNFFPLGDKWVLLFSRRGGVEYQVGDFDLAALKFQPLAGGLMNHNGQFYATHGLFNPQKQLVLFGLIKGFPNGAGWRDCLALPRIVTLGDDLRLRQTPLPELASLRREHRRQASLSVAAGRQTLAGIAGDRMEISALIAPATSASCGLRVRCSANGAGGVAIRYGQGKLLVEGVKASPAELPLTPGQPLQLRIFLDGGALEVFANDGVVAETRVMKVDPADLNVEFFADGGEARLLGLDAWTLDKIKIDR